MMFSLRSAGIVLFCSLIFVMCGLCKSEDEQRRRGRARTRIFGDNQRTESERPRQKPDSFPKPASREVANGFLRQRQRTGSLEEREIAKPSTEAKGPKKPGTLRLRPRLRPHPHPRLRPRCIK